MRPVVCLAAVPVGWDCSCPARPPEAPVPARCGSWPPPSHPAFSPDPKASPRPRMFCARGPRPPRLQGLSRPPPHAACRSPSEAASFWVSACLGMLPEAVPAAARAAPAGRRQGPAAQHRTLTLARLDEKFTLSLLKLPPLAAFRDAVLGESRCDFFFLIFLFSCRFLICTVRSLVSPGF